jgi:hypothetical protein
MFYFYCSNGAKFDSKIEAIEYSNKNNVKLYFYYYDHIYENIDWTIEPPQSLDYYYLEQARRIRDLYDYVILCYSGGYDSTNILETFHFNNLKIDKIVAVGAFDQDNYTNSDENHNGEIYFNAFPYVKELGLENILQKLDYSKLFNDTKNFSILNQNKSWIDLCGSWFSPHNWFWYDIEKHVVPDEYKNKKVCIIFGKDKPTLFYSKEGVQNKLANDNFELNGFFFRDTPVTSYASSLHKRTLYENIQRIDFYWDPDFPEILLKQLHVLYRYYSITKKNFYSVNEGVQKLGDQTVNSLIYNLRRKIIFKSPKSKTQYFSLRDNFLKEKTNNDISDLHQRGLEEIIRRTRQKESKVIFSKFYNIVKQNI